MNEGKWAKASRERVRASRKWAQGGKWVASEQESREVLSDVGENREKETNREKDAKRKTRAFWFYETGSNFGPVGPAPSWFFTQNQEPDWFLGRSNLVPK